MTNAIKPYDWGSTDVIAAIQGRPVPAPGPEAELWMGAHPSAPSVVLHAGAPVPLHDVIAADPIGELGLECLADFGLRLPFLLKVLAAQRALSIQTHPTRAQAQAGFAAEEARGVPLTAPHRIYVDDWPKPELIYAVTEFEALAGFRPAPEAVALLSRLDVPELGPAMALLSTPGEQRAEALRALLALTAAEVRAVVAACERLAANHDADSEPDPDRDALAAVTAIARDHGDDPGVAAALLLRYVRLTPGQAMFMAAGALHAYLRGTGIEILANSDNVLRAGLTSKHIDVAELLRIADPAIEAPLVPVDRVGGIEIFRTPAREFSLARLSSPQQILVPGAGPRIVFALDEPAELVLDVAAQPAQETTGRLTVERGGSAFISAYDGPVRVTGPGTVFVAGPGDGAAAS